LQEIVCEIEKYDVGDKDTEQVDLRIVARGSKDLSGDFLHSVFSKADEDREADYKKGEV
jgi:hypothetical protein